MEQDGDSPPTFWFQPPIQTRRRPPLFNPVVLIILLPILFLLIIFFLLPPFLTHTSQIIKPTSVKKSWDSLNIFLVLFAILCGVLARRNDDVPPPPTDSVIDQVNHSYNRNQLMYSSTPVREPVTGGSRLRRNSSSYPDLRQESLWETGENRFRFFDDFDLNLYSSAAKSSEYSHQRPPRSEVERDNTVYRSPASTRPSDVVEKENGLPAVSDYFHDVPRRRNEVERENDVYRSPPSLRRSEVEIGNVFHQSQSAVNFHNVPQQTEVGRQNDIYQSPPSSRRSEAEIGNIMHGSQSAVTLDYFPDPLWPSELERDYSEVKEIPVDTFQVHRYPSSPLTPKSPAPEPPPLPPVAKFKPRNSYHSVRRKERVRIKNEIETDLIEKRRPPPPKPPPPPPIIHRSETKLKKLDRQISDATKEIATAFTSLYNQRKRKKKSSTRNIHNNATLSPQSSHSSPEQIAPLPPPPPPLPPPPSVFQNMFKKRNEHKRIHSVAAVAPPPPSPPPLPPSSISNNLFKSGGKSKRFSSSSIPPPPPPPPPPSSNRNIFKSGSISKRNSSSTPLPPPPPLPSPLLKAVSVCTISDDPIVYTQSSRRKSCVPLQSSPPLPTPPNSEHLRRRPSRKVKPPLPSKASNSYEREEYITNSGSQSPLFPIPPPPPPPPFKMSELKFKIRGDFVSLRSAQSSVCNSPDRENIDFTGMQELLEEFDGGDVVGPVAFPPSPDVNVKADSFISRLKDEWRMEKVNSVKSRRTMGHSILGLDQELGPN